MASKNTFGKIFSYNPGNYVHTEWNTVQLDGESYYYGYISYKIPIANYLQERSRYEYSGAAGRA